MGGSALVNRDFMSFGSYDGLKANMLAGVTAYKDATAEFLLLFYFSLNILGQTLF